jgi:hypothetical protein
VSKDCASRLEVGMRVAVISSPDGNCERDVIWGVGVITHIGSRTEVHFDNGNGGMFPHECIYPELTSAAPERVSWREVSGHLRTNGWKLTYQPVDGLPPYHWRSPQGISGSEFRSNDPDNPPEAVMLEAIRDGLVEFTHLAPTH